MRGCMAIAARASCALMVRKWPLGWREPKKFTSIVVATWLSDGEYVWCSCSERTAHVGPQAALRGRRRDLLVRTATPSPRAVRAAKALTPMAGLTKRVERRVPKKSRRRALRRR